jgi:hypothetical protein
LLAQRVADTIRTGDSVGLVAEIQKLGFAEDDSRLIALAVRITRPDLKAPDESIETEGTRRGEGTPKLFDATAVTVLFNMVNRIASAYGLVSEWSWWRRGERIRRITRPLMSLLTRSLISLTDEEPQTRTPAEIDLRPLFRAIGYTPDFSICEMLVRNPELAVIVYGLLSASVTASELDETIQPLIVGACSGNTQSAPREVGMTDVFSSPRPALESGAIHETVNRFAEKLFARPYSVSPSDLSELRQQGLDEGRILDLVFRVSVLAGIAKLDAAPLAESISSPV